MRNIWVPFLRKTKPTSLKYVVKTRFISLDSSILYTFSNHTLCKVCSTWDQYPCNKTLTDQRYCQTTILSDITPPFSEGESSISSQSPSSKVRSGGYLMMEVVPGKTNQDKAVFNLNSALGIPNGSALHGIPSSEDMGLRKPPPPKGRPPTGKFL